MLAKATCSCPATILTPLTASYHCSHACGLTRSTQSLGPSKSKSMQEHCSKISTYYVYSVQFLFFYCQMDVNIFKPAVIVKAMYAIVLQPPTA